MNLLRDPTKRRWLAWAALGTVFLLVNVHRLSTAVLSGDLEVTFELTATQLGTLHASFFLVYALIQIPTGVLVDRVGPRAIGTAGAVVLSAGAILFTLAGGFHTALLARGLVGLGSGVIFVSILRFCANWYRTDEFATMTGLTAAIAGLGAIVATTPLALTVEALGWQPTVQGLGVIGLLAAGAVYVLARSSPSDAGLEPIDRVPEQPSVTFRETGQYLRTLVGDHHQWLLSLTFFASMGTIMTLLGLWGVPYLVVVYGLDVTTASYYTMLGSIGMFIGGPIIGWISDRLNRRLLPMAVGLALFTANLAIIPVVGKPPLAVVAGSYFLSGFLIGASVLALSIVKERYPPEASGVATATVNGAGFVGASMLPAVMGLAIDRYRTGEVVAGTVVYTEFGYRVAFGLTAVVLGIAFLCSLYLLVSKRRHRSDTKAGA